MCDRTNDRLQIFRKDGTFVSEHVFEKDTRGTGPIAVDRQGNICTAEVDAGQRIQKFRRTDLQD